MTPTDTGGVSFTVHRSRWWTGTGATALPDEQLGPFDTVQEAQVAAELALTNPDTLRVYITKHRWSTVVVYDSKFTTKNADGTPHTRVLIISLTPGLSDAEALAQKRANDKKEPFGLWEHVGLYGRPEGDIPSRHIFKSQPLSVPDPPPDWALVGLVNPESER